MRSATIARNYAATLLTLAELGGAREEWGTLILAVGDAIDEDLTLRRFLESPRIDGKTKSAVLARALDDRAPAKFVGFLKAVVRHRRQLLLPQIATEYQSLLDVAEGRVHARVTVAKAVDDGERQAIAAQLSRALAKEVIPHLTVDPAILGGVVVRVGDQVMDGSVRRRLSSLRNQLIGSAGR